MVKVVSCFSDDVEFIGTIVVGEFGVQKLTRIYF